MFKRENLIPTPNKNTKNSALQSNINNSLLQRTENEVDKKHINSELKAFKRSVSQSEIHVTPLEGHHITDEPIAYASSTSKQPLQLFTAQTKRKNRKETKL